ncbi:hypothetical protein [Polluticoccus soli]|uniref:hypothetical protein n=1 Tax=Polluticoccus soli TaxID=3034150 RepID=UPI0023E2B99C|nr:hypothetical protein [Flavipsychrobacter sp. JY13-12]
MEKQPLTRQQAEDLREQFSHLVGQPLNTGVDDSLVIDCVAVVPYDDINRYIYLIDYRECRDVIEALGFYVGPLFDVVLISVMKSDRTQVFYKELRTYLQEQNLNRADQLESPEVSDNI